MPTSSTAQSKKRRSGREQHTIARARPVFKWAGGKSQLLETIDAHLPESLKTGELTTYIEPFIGGGAVFFHVASCYPLKKLIIADINPDVILVYRAIAQNVETLILYLKVFQRLYEAKANADDRKSFYYFIRQKLNEQRHLIEQEDLKAEKPLGPYGFQRAAEILFLNRTCYNGLFRVNSKGEFNVPFGRYVRPTICHSDNLRTAAKILKKTRILLGDFQACQQYLKPDKTFVYLDPPYRPLSKTASFNAYAQYRFDDDEQLRLCEFFKQCDKQNILLMLSNADPQNTNPEDRFFDDAYTDFSIRRVVAKRMINTNSKKRGKIHELLITNYAKS